MDLRHLRYFVAVAEELHFGRAAERLHLAQQPLSFQIKQLEEELGVTLFERTTRRVELTEAGRLLLAEVQHALLHLEKGVRDAQRAGRGELGNMMLGYVSTTLYNIMPATVRLFHERFPDVEMTLQELCSSDITERLLTGSMDAGLLIPGSRAPELEYETLLLEPASVVLPRQHPLARHTSIPLRALASEPFVMYERRQKSHIYDQIMTLCKQAGFSPHIAQEAVSEQAVIGLVAAGAGISLVSCCLNGLRTEEVVYRPLTEPAAYIEYAIAWKKGNHSPTLQALRSIAREVATLEQSDKVSQWS